MNKIICFGEVMLRLNPQNYDRFIQSNTFAFHVGGGEANAAVTLANFDMDVAFVTKLPTHAIGQIAVNDLRAHGVDTTKITRGGDRVGLYFCEKGASVRPSNVIYDRAGSAIALASAADFDWDAIFDGATWFHFTGITPALGENLAKITLQACKIAKEKGLTVSCDWNYRKKLWTIAQASLVLGNLMQYVDVCFASEDDADKLFGIRAPHADPTSDAVDFDACRSVAKQLAEHFGCKYVALTLRRSISASDNNWSAMLYNHADGISAFSRVYPLHIVDRVGGGDSFDGALIYALLKGYTTSDAVEFAVAASALKHTIEGDYNLVSVEEVEALLRSGGSGRIQR